MLCLLLLLPADAGRSTPGLVVETGARHSTADGVAFTPDGGELLAWGEDKVVRRWAVSGSGFASLRSRNLRWPQKSGEPRGSVFALGFDSRGEQCAVGGFGFRDGLVVRFGLKEGKILDAASPVQRGVVWAIAYSPDDRFVVYGNDFGELFRWDLERKKVEPFASSVAGAKPAPNRMRLVSFTGPDRFVSVAMDGAVREWSLSRPGKPPAVRARLTVPNVLRAVLDPGNRWLAACGSNRDGTAAEAAAVGVVELVDLSGKEEARRIKLPDEETTPGVRCLALDSAGRLAIGCQEFPKGLKERDFYRVVGGSVHLYDIGRKGFSTAKVSLGFRADALAFHPKRPGVLAVAGGDHHEVGLYSTRTGKPLGGGASSVVRSPGNCVYGVAFSSDGKSFGWRDRRNPEPTGRSDWAAGPWRVFDIAARDLLGTAPPGFKPVEPLLEADGWKIEPTKATRVWEVAGPGGVRVRLEGSDGSVYNSDYNQEPKCWTFIRAKRRPLMLAIGHLWGASLYECGKDGVKLVRVMNGHEGEVMSVAANAEGTLLLTGGRDQTVCCWSLAKWPSGTEMGARFGVKRGKLVVEEVDNGSPAWEAFNPLRGTDEEPNRLKAGDEIELAFIANEKFVYDPAGLFDGEVKARRLLRITDKPTTGAFAAQRMLKEVKPAQQYILGKRIGGKGPLVYKITTVRQRPLWRMFATRAAVGREWVIWRPRDFYYDTSANADSFVGWHVNPADPAETPAFHPLERFRGTSRVGKANGFHRPDLVWRFLLAALPPVEKVSFADIEAPRVSVRVVREAGAMDLQVEVSVAPADKDKAEQAVGQSVLVVNQTEVAGALKAGTLDKAVVTIPRDRLQWGRNVVRVLSFNAAGGRGEASATTEYTPPGKPTATLHALVVGINDYTAAAGYDPRDGIDNLQCSRTDAAEMKQVLEQHARSKLFGKSNIDLVQEKDATATNILSRLRKLAAAAKPDDWLVVYLSGHGDVDYMRDEKGKVETDTAGKKIPVPRTYFYVCRDFDARKPETKLTSRALYAALSSVPCRKLLILDTCHSGGATVIPSDGARDFNPEGRRFIVMSSCQTDQKALEPASPDEKFRHGFFTHALLDLIADSTRAKGKLREEAVPSNELAENLPKKLEEVQKAFGVIKGSRNFYSPAFLLTEPATLPVLCRPPRKK
ncbi:MAG: caspase family protein [Gemmataceae bacterium]|nr:caspase family protein [Gemmataceae bacterium]